jgi:hypothetical protein
MRPFAAALAITGLAVAVFAAGGARPDMRYDGEHGLWVEVAGDSVVVHYITADPRDGRLEAMIGGRVIAEVATPAAFAHRAAFHMPDDAWVTLRYGAAAAGAERYETTLSLAAPALAPFELPAIDSVYIIGDTHGMYDALVEGMNSAGLIDDALRWSGGRRHVVFAGDLMDRGPDVAGLLWLVYRLEREAAAAGGGVHVVLGNHELMVMLGDDRYVHPKEAEIANLHRTTYRDMYDTRVSVLGRWLASKPALLRIGDVLIAHGGLGPQYAALGITALHDSLRTFMGEQLFHVWSDTTVVIEMDSAAFERRSDLFWGSDSPFWHRAFIQSDTLHAQVDAVLAAMRSRMVVVGHTPVDSIHARYDGRIVAAHTPRFGAEFVLLVREGDTYRRYRVARGGKAPFEE